MTNLTTILRAAVIAGSVLVPGFAATGLAASSVADGQAERPGLQVDAVGSDLVRGSTTSGRFLAARHAEVVGDLVVAADLTAQIIADVPNSANVRRRAQLLMVSAGRLGKAAELATGVLESNPGDPLATYTLYVDDMRNERFESAFERASNVTVAGVNGILVPLLKAWALAGQERSGDAIVELESMAGEQGLGAIAGLHQALIADIDGDIGRARDAFEFAMEKSGERPSLQLVDSYARFLMRQGDAAQARELVQGFASQNPETLLIESAQAVVAGTREPVRLVATVQQGAAEVFRNISGLLNRERLNTEALMFLRMSLALEPDNPTALFSLGQLLEQRSRGDLAIDAYRQINADTPYHWYARLSIADALHTQDASEEAIAILRKMADERADRVDAIRALADILRIEERYPEAIEAYDRAFDRAGGKAEWQLYYTRGIALERGKNWARAEQDFLKALEIEPDQPLVLNYLGYSWVEQGVHLERAKAMIETAVAKRPEDGYITDSLGWVLYRMGDFEPAVGYLERAVALEPGDPVINDHLGDAYWMVGRRNEARFQWIRALSLEPDADVETEIRLKLDGKKEPTPLPPGKNRDI